MPDDPIDYANTGAPPVEERFASLDTVRPNFFTWPRDKPFPWSDAKCAAFVRGYQVYWPLGVGEFLSAWSPSPAAQGGIRGIYPRW